MADRYYEAAGRQLGKLFNEYRDEFMDKIAQSSEIQNPDSTPYSEFFSKADESKIEFAFRFYKLNSIAVDIIAFLHRTGGTFHGNYSEFTVALGRKSGPTGHVPNVRKVLLDLSAQGIVLLHKQDSKRVNCIELNKYWVSKI